MTKIAISMIINCHREGVLAHKSMLCFEQIRHHTESQGLNVEWVVIIDNGDIETKRIVTNPKFLRDSDQLYEVTFTDLGLSRNFGIQNAKGQYLSLFDADDFYSKNWLFAAFHLAEKFSAQHIYHPEYSILFDQSSNLIKWYDQESSAKISQYNLLKNNLWPSSCFAKKSVFEATPYGPVKTGSGFGYEDWHWNCETIAKGVCHKIVPQTILFYRIKEMGSLCMSHFKANSLIKPSQLFNQLRVNNAII